MEVLSSHVNTVSRGTKSIVDEVTTLRRHLEAHHSVGDILTVLLSQSEFDVRQSIVNGQRVSISCRNCQVMSKNARRPQNKQLGRLTRTSWRRN
jgi:hypothetical protein